MGDTDAKSTKPFKQRKSFGKPFDLYTISIWYLCCCYVVVDGANVTLMYDAISLHLVSRRDEVAGIRAKFPSKIPVSMI